MVNGKCPVHILSSAIYFEMKWKRIRITIEKYAEPTFSYRINKRRQTKHKLPKIIMEIFFVCVCITFISMCVFFFFVILVFISMDIFFRRRKSESMTWKRKKNVQNDNRIVKGTHNFPNDFPSGRFAETNYNFPYSIRFILSISVLSKFLALFFKLLFFISGIVVAFDPMVDHWLTCRTFNFEFTTRTNISRYNSYFFFLLLSLFLFVLSFHSCSILGQSYHCRCRKPTLTT